MKPFSGFKTKAYTRPNVTIPPGAVNIVIDLQRGNLVKAFSIVATVSICKLHLFLY
jgi:hypothetical protein